MFIHVVNATLQMVTHGRNGTSNGSSLKEFLLSTPRGAYTTAFMVNEYTVLNWDIHLERLMKSVEALHNSLSGCRYDTFYDYLAAVESTATVQNQNDFREIIQLKILQFIIMPSVLVALNAATGRCGRSGQYIPETHRISEDNDRKSLQTAPLRVLTIVLTPSLYDSTPLEQRGIDVHVAISSKPPGTIITDPLPGSVNHSAIVSCPPRDIPIGKDSNWVKQRQKWEQNKPQGAVDILLCREDGSLLEGMVTNLFIIRSNLGSMATGLANSSGTEQNKTALQTAGTEDGVVWGTIRALVIHASRDLGLEVIETPPCPSESKAWSEGFLTNALRGIQPLRAINRKEDNFWNLPPWNHSFCQAPGPWTWKIKKRIDELLLETNLLELSDVNIPSIIRNKNELAMVGI